MMTITSPAQPERRRVLRSLLGLSALLLVLTGPAPTWATATTAPELRFLELVNHERTTRGVTPWD